MTTPVDLTNLGSIIDGDIERALFDEFYDSFEKDMAALKTHRVSGAGGAWRADAHGLKGIALNLGAEKLGALCKKAQDDHLAEAGVKDAMLRNIEAEYGIVKAFLRNIHLDAPRIAAQ